jgi:hypothetical protein
VPAPPSSDHSVRPSWPRWWRLPWWLVSLATGAKSFVDNPLLGSRRLNRLGLHAARVRLAHRLAANRRHRLAANLPQAWRETFDRDGFVEVRDFLSPADFIALRDSLVSLPADARAQQQGDTLTTRVPVDPAMLARIPALERLLARHDWQGLMSYVASFRTRPLYYLQAIAAGIADGPPDPQQQLHADTFHPSMKAWLFLTDVDERGSPLTFVAGSHRLTPERLAWERRRSLDVLTSGDRLSQRGSFRIDRSELAELGLPQPTAFTVPANTLVVIDTCGFHARGPAPQPSLRAELWAYCRRSPFIPWTGFDLLSLPPFADRRATWATRALDWLDRRGWARQHWLPAGLWTDHLRLPRPADSELRPAIPLTTAEPPQEVKRRESRVA